MRTPSIHTSAHGTALMLSGAFGTLTVIVAVFPAPTWTVRRSANPRLSLTRRSSRLPAGNMIFADAVEPSTWPASMTVSGIGEVIASHPAAGPAAPGLPAAGPAAEVAPLVATGAAGAGRVARDGFSTAGSAGRSNWT